MISNFKKRSWFGTVASLLLIISIGITGLTGCSNTKAPAKSKTTLPAAEVYKNTFLGLSLTFPANWSGKYTVKETTQGIYVYFKPKQKVADGEGLYFCILKKTKDFDGSHYDSINGKREVTLNGMSYFLGSPTDISFPNDNSEFSDFRKLQSQIPDIIDSIKPLK